MDRRVKYTKKIIRETLINLLSEKDLKQITVSEICNIADINRATFYRYYLDVYDLLEKIEDDFVQEIKAAASNSKEYSVSSFSKELLTVFLDNKELVKILFNAKNNVYFLYDILEVAYEKCKEKWQNDYINISEEDIEYATLFIFNGALGVINFWVQNDFDKDIDEISNIIELLSNYGTRRFIYKK